MSLSMSPNVYTENLVALAEEHFQRGNLNGALEIMHTLTFRYENSSANHRRFSQILEAYEIHRRNQQGNSLVHYRVLKISNLLGRHELIERNYRDLVDKLCVKRNKSGAAKSALEILNTAWSVLSDPKSRRDYHIQEGLVWRNRLGGDIPNQAAEQGKRPSIEVIDISDSDSDSN